MMHIFHSWSKWSVVKTEQWTKHNYYSPNNNYEFTKFFQERICERCGKYERRYIEID